MNILDIYDIYNEEICRTDEKIVAAMLVGSYPQENNGRSNDIDLFVILDGGLSQTRRIKIINGVELDINYFPLKLARELIDKGEYFFIYELSERARVLLDTDGAAESLVQKARKMYLQGPKPLNQDELWLIRHEINSLIKRTKTETDKVQRDINIMSCLVKLLKAYFASRGLWCPKEKNIVNALRKHDETIYCMSKELIEGMDIENLDKISERVFENLSIPDELIIEY